MFKDLEMELKMQNAGVHSFVTFQNDQISLEQEQNILFGIVSAHEEVQ